MTICPHCATACISAFLSCTPAPEYVRKLAIVAVVVSVAILVCERFK